MPIFNTYFLSPRLVHFGFFMLATCMMLVAYYFFQLHLSLQPCPMCVSQRIFAIAFGLVGLIAFIHNPVSRWAKATYSFLIACFALGGAVIAGRQVYLQSLPDDQVPICGPTLPYLIDYFPFQDVVNAMFFGEGSCSEIKWQILGLSIPAWVLVCFVFVVIAAVWHCFKIPSETP